MCISDLVSENRLSSSYSDSDSSALENIRVPYLVLNMRLFDDLTVLESSSFIIMPLFIDLKEMSLFLFIPKP
jgi:hypothetical protein